MLLDGSECGHLLSAHMSPPGCSRLRSPSYEARLAFSSASLSFPFLFMLANKSNLHPQSPNPNKSKPTRRSTTTLGAHDWKGKKPGCRKEGEGCQISTRMDDEVPSLALVFSEGLVDGKPQKSVWLKPRRPGNTRRTRPWRRPGKSDPQAEP